MSRELALAALLMLMCRAAFAQEAQPPAVQAGSLPAALSVDGSSTRLRGYRRLSPTDSCRPIPRKARRRRGAPPFASLRAPTRFAAAFALVFVYHPDEQYFPIGSLFPLRPDEPSVAPAPDGSSVSGALASVGDRVAR